MHYPTFLSKDREGKLLNMYSLHSRESKKKETHFRTADTTVTPQILEVEGRGSPHKRKVEQDQKLNQLEKSKREVHRNGMKYPTPKG